MTYKVVINQIIERVHSCNDPDLLDLILKLLLKSSD